MRLGLIPLAFAAVLTAQTPAPQTTPPANDAAVGGMVRDKGTGKPLAHFTVFTDTHATWVGNTIVSGSSSKTIRATTDETGLYRLSGLAAGYYRITARNAEVPGSSSMTRDILLAGHDLQDINFDVVAQGAVKGKVMDENREPVPGVDILLVAREYYLGRAGYFLRGFGGRTNDRGEYRIQGLDAGRPYMLLAERRQGTLPAHSETPLNPKLRRPIPMRTWYLNSPSADGAVEVVVRPGEVREAVDIEMKKSPSYCAEGTLTVAGAPAVLNFTIEALQPSSGLSPGGGMFRGGPGGQTGSDGEFRICDLYPGTYRLTATNASGNFGGQTPVFGVTVLSIGDEDLKGIKIAALPGAAVEGEVVLDGPVPNNPLTTKVSVSIEPLLRTFFQGENANTRADIPGTFTLPPALMDDFAVRVFLNAPGLYVKDVTYANQSVLHAPLRLGSAIGNAGMRVIVGQDGAKLSASVAGKDGNPVPDTNIVIVPVENVSEGALAANLVTGKTDQNGQYTSQTLAPGRYYVAATDELFDASAASIARLWASHHSFTEVDLAPNGQASVTLAPLQPAR